MKDIKKFPYSLALLLILLIGFSDCSPGPGKTELSFSGRVVDREGEGVVEALIEVGDKDATTNKAGDFTIVVDPTERYVLNVTKLGFGFASKIYADTASNLVIRLTQATVVEVDPQEDIIVEDEEPEISTPLSADVGTLSSPLDTIAFIIDSTGRLIGFGAPPEIADTYEAAEEFTTDQQGATVEVPADALVDPEETNEGAMLFQDDKGKTVTASVSTVDIYSSDGMPGDYTIIGSDGETRGYMETFGAVDINFYRNGKPLQLRKGKKAKITMPIDNITRKYFGKELPQTMKMWVYDKKKGIWTRDGKNEGRLNEKGTAYVAEVSHFSVFNMDEEFATPTCYKMCASGIPVDAQIEVSVPGHIKPFYPLGVGCAGTCSSPPCQIDCSVGEEAHVVIYMAPNQPMGVRIADNLSTVRSTYVFLAGAPSTPHETDCSNSYDGCSGPGHITFEDECWKTTTPVDGTLKAPITAAMFSGNDIDFSWVFIESITGAAVTNSSLYYEIEYQTYLTNDSFDPVQPWSTVDFDPGLPQQDTFPSLAGAATTDWKIDQTVDFSGATGATNAALNPADIILFRVNYSVTGTPGTFTNGFVHIINLSSATDANFQSDFEGEYSCYTQ